MSRIRGQGPGNFTLEPGGFLTRDDPALFTTLRGSAASMLARLWVTGY
ncbi:hypothetical protein ACFT4A_42465 [Streptomyces sp. NPDC057099]